MLSYFQSESYYLTEIQRTFTSQNINIMKKLVLFFVIALFSCNAQAQTFSETQERVFTETAKLEKRLSEIKKRIIYLEVTVPDRMKKTKTLSELRELEKEDYFSKDETARLRNEMTDVKNALTEVTKTGLKGVEYRTEADMKSNLPDRMNQREYAQRVRANDLKSETSGDLFKGILINHKTGLGEKAIFYIYRKGVAGLPVKIISLDPQEKFIYYLPAGDYNIKIICGSNEYNIEAHARPNEFKWVDGQQYSWFAEKLLADS